MILLFTSGGVTNVTMLLDRVYVAGFAIRPFIESINCDVAAVLPILVPRSIVSHLNLNESLDLIELRVQGATNEFDEDVLKKENVIILP